VFEDGYCIIALIVIKHSSSPLWWRFRFGHLSCGFSFHCLTIDIGIVVLSEAYDLAFFATEVISPIYASA
jgi:hypothetical protein